jgi:hypothetical protein
VIVDETSEELLAVEIAPAIRSIANVLAETLGSVEQGVFFRQVDSIAGSLDGIDRSLERIVEHLGAE